MTSTEGDVTFTGLSASLVGGTTYWLVIHQASFITGVEYFDWHCTSGTSGTSMYSSSPTSWIVNNNNYPQKFTLYR